MHWGIIILPSTGRTVPVEVISDILHPVEVNPLLQLLPVIAKIQNSPTDSQINLLHTFGSGDFVVLVALGVGDLLFLGLFLRLDLSFIVDQSD
jgi:hypothetical protein